MRFSTAFVTNIDGSFKIRFDESLPLINIGGVGMPDVQYISEAPVSGSGQLLYNTIITSRSISLSFMIPTQPTQTEYANKRLELIKVFAPSLNGNPNMWLYVSTEQGRMYRIQGRYMGGLEDTNATTHGGEVITVTLFCPKLLWEDTQASVLASVAGGSSGTFKFPLVIEDGIGIIFGSGTRYTSDITPYVGNYICKPLIRLYGSFTAAKVYHRPTGALIDFREEVGDGDYREIDFDVDGRYYAFDSDGNDVTNELAYYSDLIGMLIYPNNYFSGQQYFEAIFSGNTSGNTACEIEYRNRYMGI